MAILFLRHLGWFWLLALVQVLVFNHICLLGYAMPFLYIYLMFTLPVNVSRNALLVWGFLLGLVVDVFSNTPGMNAAATTLLALIRPWLVSLFAPRDSSKEMQPGIRTMGFWLFFRYVLVGTFIHHTLLLSLESFSFLRITTLLLSVVLSTLLSTCCVVAVEGISKK